MRLDRLEHAILPQFPGLQKIVPALPRFWVDCILIPDRLRKDADSGAIGDVFLQFVYFPGFWCNPFDPLAILRSFAISSQFNWIVKTAVKIALPMFWSQSDAREPSPPQSPAGCKSLCRHCRGFELMSRPGPVWVGSSPAAIWANPGPICCIWLQSVWIV